MERDTPPRGPSDSLPNLQSDADIVKASVRSTEAWGRSRTGAAHKPLEGPSPCRVLSCISSPIVGAAEQDPRSDWNAVSGSRGVVDTQEAARRVPLEAAIVDTKSENKE